MEVFLVRHGQTDGNTAHRHQLDKTPLTFTGEDQAKVVADKIKKMNPTNLVTSPVVRAVETARVIGETCDLVPETDKLFAELERPQNLTGNYHVSLSSTVYYLRWYFGLFKQVNGTGESYEVFRNRIEAAREYLEKLPADARVVVVSHSVFINLFVAHVCDRTPLRPLKALRIFWKVLSMPNTQITLITYNQSTSPNTCSWHLLEPLES